ncbi:hypothetical protein ACIA49_23815 [Kribbella sp. NPDC051587]|uniref:hypothetical protein n=1 Tax=Kribbella sp. NPDC051587 TaxID=3364119 RepID=UPI00379A732A
MRSVSLAAAALAGVVLLAGCGGNSDDGGRPVPVGGDSDTSSTPTPSASSTPPPSTKPSEVADPTTTPPKKAQVIVVPGNYSSNPAVQGLVATYPMYFDALIARNEKLISKTFPAYFYADVSQVMVDARNNGWVMKPPGSVVVRGISNQALGVVRVKTCRSQHTQYWNPKTKGWTLVAPGGQPQAIDMIKTGLGWRPYRLGPSAGISCAGVKYPA